VNLTKKMSLINNALILTTKDFLLMSYGHFGSKASIFREMSIKTDYIFVNCESLKRGDEIGGSSMFTND
jgi:hypothetical protein